MPKDVDKAEPPHGGRVSAPHFGGSPPFPSEGASTGLCWVDATMLMHDTPPAGIPRTVATLLCRWPAELRDRVRFFRFVDKVGFRLVEPAKAWVRAAEIAGGGGSASKPGGKGGSSAGRMLASLANAPIKGLDRLARRLRKSFGLRWSSSLGLTSNDSVLLPGGHFPPKFYFQELSRQTSGRGVEVWSLYYDLLPEICPQYFDESLCKAYSECLREVLAIDSKILAISEHTKADFLEFARGAGRPEPQVEVIRLGDELHLDDGPLEGRHGLAERFGEDEFVLCVSHFHPRKNQEILYQTWRKLAVQRGGRTPHLVFVSGGTVRRHELVAEIRRDPLLKGRAHLLERVSESELNWLYRRSKFVMYPAIYEGWGLPVAEALALGKYCIASNTSSIPEIGGDLVDYHDPSDLQECVRLVTRALDDPEYVRRRERRVQAEYRTTTWTDCAAQIASTLFRRTPAHAATTAVSRAA